MRTKSAAQQAVLNNPSHIASAFITAIDGIGDPFDVGNVLDVEVSASVDGHSTMKVTIQRQVNKFSLAPLVIGSGNPMQPSGDPLLQVGREITAYVLVQPADSNNETFVALTVFEGFIDELSWPGDTIEINCSDKSAALRDRWIEWERAYGLCTGSNATAGAYIWNDKSDAKVLVVGDLVVPSQLKSNGHFYKVTAANAVADFNEPNWPTGSGATTSTGKYTVQEAGPTSNVGIAVETIMQQILTDNGLPYTLVVPVNPTWIITPYVQSRSNVLDALQVFADQIGWRLVFKWNTGTNRFDLTFFAPDRTGSAGSVKTVRQDEEIECGELGIDVMSIRNAVRIVWGESTARDGEGAPIRLAQTFTDATSITKYGRRFMEIAESSTSNIDSTAEATTLGSAVLADLKDPTIGISLTFPIDPHLEVGDMVTVPADGLRFSSDQTLAIESISQSVNAESQTTKVTLRGFPVARRLGWFENAAGVADSIHQLQNVDMQTPLFTVLPTVGGQRFGVSGTKESKKYFEPKMEIHLSQTSGFTPDQTTVAELGASPYAEFTNLNPGETYYAKAVPYTHNQRQKLRGPPSAEISFVAGQAKQAHYDSASTQSHLPLNGNFEHFFAGLQKPPDHWKVVPLVSEVDGWGSSDSVYYFSDTSKGFGIDLRAHATRRGRILSDVFEIRRGIRALNIYLSVMRLGSSAVSGKDLIVDIFGYNDAALTTQVINYSVFISGDAGGPFPSLSTWYDTVIDFGAGYGPIPSNVNFLKIALRRGTAGDASFSWRIGDIYVQEADFYRLAVDNLVVNNQSAWVAPTLQNSFTNYNATTHVTAGYFKDSNGRVWIRGLVMRASAALVTSIFTLPVGFRPAKNVNFAGMGNGKFARLEVTSAGAVMIDSADDAAWYGFVTLECSFDTR